MVGTAKDATAMLRSVQRLESATTIDQEPSRSDSIVAHEVCPTGHCRTTIQYTGRTNTL
jgi:hypothetical protein